MLTLRDVVLAELDKWRGEGLLSADQHATLRLRSLADPALDAAAAPRELGASANGRTREDRGERGAQAANWLQLVGGLLLGAALVALVAFLNVAQDAAPGVMLAFGVIALGGGLALAILKGATRMGLADAALATGLVPLGVASVLGPAHTMPVYGLAAAALAVAALMVRRGQGPIAVLSSVTYALGTFGAIGPELFGGAVGDRSAWLAALIAYSLLLLVYRRETWSGVAAGLLMLPHAFAFVNVLDAAGVRDSRTEELMLGAYFGAWVATGVWLNVRGLVAGAAGGLTIVAVVFAYDLGGAGPALVLLLVLGGVLVWQAEFVRRYFGKKAL